MDPSQPPGVNSEQLQQVRLQQHLLEQQKEALGLQQHAMLEAERSSHINDQEMLHKAMQQQHMLEAEKHMQMVEQQKRMIAEQQVHKMEQQQAEAIIRQQQQQEELQQRRIEEQAPPGAPAVPQQVMPMPPQPPIPMQGMLTPMTGPSQTPSHMTMSVPPPSSLQGPPTTTGPPVPMPRPPSLNPPQMSSQQISVSQTSMGGQPPRMQAPPIQQPPPPPPMQMGPPSSMQGPPPPPMAISGPPPSQGMAPVGPPPQQMQPPPPPPLQGPPQPHPPGSQIGGTPPGPPPAVQNQADSRPPNFQMGMPSGQNPSSRPLPPNSTANQPAEGEPRPLMSINTSNTNNQPPPQNNDEDKSKTVKLPQALEKVLAFKDVRAQQLGLKPEELDKIEKGEDIENQEAFINEDEIEEIEEEEVEKPVQSKKESRNKNRKKKKKKAKQHLQPPKPQPTAPAEEEDIEVEYIQDQLGIDMHDPAYMQFAKIFEMFKLSEPEKPRDQEKSVRREEKKVEPKVKAAEEEEDEEDEAEKPPEDDLPKISKKKLKKLNRLSVAELKQLVTRPDVVEMHDVTAQDPKLLVHLKATRNTVTVPRHWCFKRKYLQGKRGIEKPPFELPDYIKATGIMEMRAALQEKEDQKTLKSKMRERVRPKMGKIDIDYQKLHDAFFRWQTKPKMTIHGDLYYEGKEFETRLKEKKPGNLSDELKTALGMPIGPNSEKFPPPWLIAMQRYGPPPSYPNLKIAGLNAPIPENCSFGYHAGGWGKPPVDENGKPLYGDVFGTQGGEFQVPIQEEEIDKTRWGELESESESEESESEEESEEEVDATGLITPGEGGLVTPSGLTSVPMGMETPDMIELRKRRIEDAMDQGGDTPALYQVLPEKKTNVAGTAMMGSAHIYDISAVTAKKTGDKAATETVEVALNPEELDMDTAAMQAKYDQTVREQQSQLEKEDLSDMVAEHAAKQKKRKKQQDSGKAAKKYKEFKF